MPQEKQLTVSDHSRNTTIEDFNFHKILLGGDQLMCAALFEVITEHH